MPKTKPNVFDGQNITASEFFQARWQRSPYLFRNTSIDLNCLPNIEQLFELAADENVQSRIVYSEDDVRYQAIYDEPEAWEEVQQLKPTLLVSDIEKWYPKAMHIMSWFPFIKNWRFDDLMMSFAPNGASVGAHTDHYDVFLVQVQGTRRWSYDDQPLLDAEMVEDSELAVIANYQPQHTVELNPGDVLYLPPEIPHHGISTSDDCVTCSIGLRAPANAEILSHVVEMYANELPTQLRFKDAVSDLNHNAAIGEHEVHYLRQILSELSQATDDQIAEYFGRLVTGYRLLENDDDAMTTADSRLWQKSPFASFAYHVIGNNKAHLFVNGESHLTSLEFAQRVCNNQSFEAIDDELFRYLIEQNHIDAQTP